MITTQGKYIWALQALAMARSHYRKSERRDQRQFVNTGDIKVNGKTIAGHGVTCIPQHLQCGIQETKCIIYHYYTK